MTKRLAKRSDHVGLLLGLGQAQPNCPQSLHLLIQRTVALGQAEQRLIGLGVLPWRPGAVPGQCPRQPCFLCRSLGVLGPANERVAHLCRVPEEQFILRICLPAENWLGEIVD